MAKEIMLEDGRTALFDDNATEQEINQKLQQSGMKRQTAAANPPAAAPSPAGSTNLPGGPVLPFMGSAVNSLAFGLPEMGARALGAGPYIDQVREDYPMATTAGDVVGLVSPAKLGYKAATGIANAVGRKMAPEVVESAGQKALQDAVTKNTQTYTEATKRFDIAQARARANPTPENLKAAQDAQKNINAIAKDLANVEKTAQKNAAGSVLNKTARVGGQVAGSVMGLQTGAGLLGEARTPGPIGPGFQQGSQVAGQAVRDYNPLQFVPGMPQVTQGITSVVPGAAGYGSAIADYLSIDDMIRQEAAKRALQGPR
jgi:hypothetical protein